MKMRHVKWFSLTYILVDVILWMGGNSIDDESDKI